MAPREQKGAISKIPGHHWRHEPPCCQRLAYHLAFTKSAQEPGCTDAGCTVDLRPHWRKQNRLFVIFGEHKMGLLPTIMLGIRSKWTC
jgi:hypothetical protein